MTAAVPTGAWAEPDAARQTGIEAPHALSPVPDYRRMLANRTRAMMAAMPPAITGPYQIQ
jgi:hypothetical protein